MGEFAVGQGVPRFEDPRLVTGRGSFIDDVVLPRMAFGYVLRSQHAHARICSIDTAAAKAAPGVLCVLTSLDWHASGFGNLPTAGGLKRRDGRPMYQPPCPALVRDRVRWIGDYVAFVVAETLNQANDAAELIEVDYEPLPVVASTEGALANGAPLVWDDCPDNVCFVQLMGDKCATDAAFARADHIVGGRFVINRVTAAPMEPRGCVGVYNGADGDYTLHTGLQRAFAYRSDLATRVLKVPESKVRIIAGDIGGSFGMKTPIFNEAPLTLLASKLLGRPVKWMSSRSESFLSDPQGRDKVTEAELALDKDGHFLGLRLKMVAAVGAYLQQGMPNFTNNLNSVAGVYRTPAIYADVTGVFSNTNPVRAYRGNGRPEASYIIERLVDMAADEIGIDAAEIRRRNYIPPEAMPYKTALAFTYDSGAFERSMDLAMDMADVAGFSARREEAARRGRLRGLGMSNTIERAASGFEAAEVRFDRSGGVTLYSGSINHGQGHETVFKQIVCDRLGIDPREVRYVQGDTEKVAMGEGTGGSRTATVGGSAFHAATEKVVGKAKRIAAHALGLDPEDIAFADGILSSPKTNRTLTIKEVARMAAAPANLPADIEAGLNATGIFNSPVANYPNGCHVCEVEIDPETGAVQVVRYSVVDDVGTVLNPLLLHGQIHGGVVQGIGQILMEDVHFDEAGQLVTGSFMD
ncbi:MAG: aerobic carbon-monoxide dehydrogenase large subunit, partial [Alphaproteobacteria bacterium]|nr:aerobic carbon-monoxide dehydrogenase large subunit [Alphaproteobacteria bacterium]